MKTTATVKQFRPFFNFGFDLYLFKRSKKINEKDVINFIRYYQKRDMVISIITF